MSSKMMLLILLTAYKTVTFTDNQPSCVIKALTGGTDFTPRRFRSVTQQGSKRVTNTSCQHRSGPIRNERCKDGCFSAERIKMRVVPRIC